MPGAIFPPEDSSVGARQKVSAGERLLDPPIYTSRYWETLEAYKLACRNEDRMWCVMIREARYEFLWPTLVRVNGKYEGRLGMNVEHTHDWWDTWHKLWMDITRIISLSIDWWFLFIFSDSVKECVYTSYIREVLSLKLSPNLKPKSNFECIYPGQEEKILSLILWAYSIGFQNSQLIYATNPPTPNF